MVISRVLRARSRVPLARRTLLHDRVRLAISVGGIGFAILLVLLLQGITKGTVAKVTAYIDRVGADVFVARQGVTNMALASSVLPQGLADELGRLPDVRAATGVMRFPIIADANGRKRSATLIGYDLAGPFGGPWKLASGRAVGRDDEAVVDEVLAGELGLGLGDQIAISGRPFTIVGLSGETAALAGKLVFLSRPAVQALLGAEGLVNFVLIRLQPDADPSAVSAALKARFPDVTALTRRQLSDNDRELLGDLFAAPINMMSSVGFLVGLAIIGLTMYTTTAERQRDFGVLKAIGARNAFLFRTVIAQAAALGIAGFAVGIIATWLSGPLVIRFAPEIGVTVTAGNAIRVFAAMMLMSLLGAVVPVVRIMRVDPLMVFRS